MPVRKVYPGGLALHREMWGQDMIESSTAYGGASSRGVRDTYGEPSHRLFQSPERQRRVRRHRRRDNMTPSLALRALIAPPKLSRTRSRVAGVLLGLLACTVSCTPIAASNATASLGGDVPGARGNISLQFINNTPFRAIFTYGTYDPQNATFQPQFGQFIVDAVAANRLEGNSTSTVITFIGNTGGTTGVGRSVSLGGDRLIQLIKDNKLESNAAALQPGITFSSAALDSPDADQPTAGRAPADEAFIGIDYQHDSLIVYTFNVDAAQASGFRIDRTVILP